MKKVTKGILGSVVVLVVLLCAGATVIYWFFPEVLLAGVRSSFEQAAGLEAKSVTVDGYVVPYYEGGQGEPLVLIHGFGDSMISFVQTAKWLTPHYRVILPEVPGFGETQHDPERKYGIRSQVEILHAAFQSLGLTAMHLGGNSMGGHIAAAYALKYPGEVKSILLIDAAGVTVSEGTPYADSQESMRTPEDFDAYMKKIFVQPPPIPYPFKKYLIDKGAANGDWLNRIRSDIRADEDYILNDRVGNIIVPTFILWGDQDQLVSLAVGEAYHERIAGSEFVVFTNCGHCPQYERIEETAQAILAFLKGLAAN